MHTFSNGISAEVNKIMRLVSELAYFEATIQLVSHYAMKQLKSFQRSP